MYRALQGSEVFPSSPGTSHDLFNITLFVSYKSLVLPPRRIRNASILDVLSLSMHSSYIQKAREKHGFQMRRGKAKEREERDERVARLEMPFII